MPPSPKEDGSKWSQGAYALVTLGYQQINNRTKSCNIPNSCWGNSTKTESLHHTKLSPPLVPEITDHSAQYTSSQFKKKNNWNTLFIIYHESTDSKTSSLLHRIWIFTCKTGKGKGETLTEEHTIEKCRRYRGSVKRQFSCASASGSTQACPVPKTFQSARNIQCNSTH